MADAWDESDYVDVLDKLSDNLNAADDARAGIDRGRSSWEKMPTREKQWDKNTEDEVGLRASLLGAYDGQEKATKVKEVLDPPPIMDGSETWGQALRKTLDWKQRPLEDRQIEAAANRQLKANAAN